MKQQIKTLIKQAIQKLYPDVKIEFSVDYPPSGVDADFASNVALVLAKKLGKKPMEIAEQLKAVIARIRRGGDEAIPEIAAPLVGLGARNDKLIVIIASPGFLNFKVSNEELLKTLKEINKKPEKYGASNIGKKKPAIVEYFQLNIAKRPHVGHMRSAVIGDALKRIFLATGYKAISDTHVGDWGTQFGILLLELKGSEPHIREQILSGGNAFEKLENIYITGNENIAREPSRLEAAKKEFAKLEAGDTESRGLWQKMVDFSMLELEKSSKLLGLLPFDEHKGESSYEKDLPAIVDDAVKKAVATKKPDGAVVVDLTGDDLDEAVLVKSDGASTYLLRDLATIKYRKKEHKFSKNIYVVDVRQSHHFKQVFRVADKLGYEGVGESQHVSYGFVKLPEGIMSTRQGNIISIEAVIKEASTRALKIIEEKNPNLKNKLDIAQQVGLGALKYFDLKHNRNNDIVFDWNEALSFEGNTGPYLQYTHARLKSILRKGRIIKVSAVQSITNQEKAVLRKLLLFPDKVADAAADFLPSILAEHLYDLAAAVNSFYHASPVLQEKDKNLRKTRLAIVSASASVLKIGLNLLGIEAPEEM